MLISVPIFAVHSDPDLTSTEQPVARTWAARLIAAVAADTKFDNYRRSSTVSVRQIDAKSVLSPTDGQTDGRTDAGPPRVSGRTLILRVAPGPIALSFVPCCIIQGGERASVTAPAASSTAGTTAA